MSEHSQEPTTAHTKKLLYDTNERVLCFHGPLMYEAKILERQWMENDPEFDGPYYLVHYKGWKRTWDEWVPETRVLRWTESNLRMQQKLKEMYSKRSRETSTEEAKDNEYLLKPEVRLDIPDSLKGLLIDDWENVTKNQQLVSLPRTPTAAEFLDQYRRFKLESKRSQGTEQLLDEVVQGIRDYFNKALGSMLLYRFERHQYASSRKKFANKDAADVYGAEHLLRLFVQMPLLIAQTDMDQDAVSVLIEYMSDIMKYMQKMQRDIFLKEYENAGPEYVSLTNTT
ncbi:MRG-domain-containing protein [Syncephalastrum racemosum]|uniref:Chromatin modification-related protein EAF3 n=1 Tax=Syncephalastrum racemosum TaxID=13706 RepID=A0A1X2H906_SYNRA|nr:MRG-domain-containing protein [Syncephalastrum racemosum]